MGAKESQCADLEGELLLFLLLLLPNLLQQQPSDLVAFLFDLQELEGDKPLTPTNFKEFMADQAQQTMALNEAVAQFKLFCKQERSCKGKLVQGGSGVWANMQPK